MGCYPDLYNHLLSPTRMPKACKITKHEREVMTEFLPHIILPLVRRQVITDRSLDDPKALWRLVVKNARMGTKEMQFGVAIEASFLEQSIGFWRNGEQLIAVVLYATAVEQDLRSNVPTHARSPRMEEAPRD